MTDDLLPLMEVAFMPPFPNPMPLDEEGELAWLDLRDLFIDPKYQRPVGFRGEKNIKQVIENFSWSNFSPIVVGPRDKGRYAVIDGQHRAIAALTHGGISKVPALIIKGGPHAEAKAFSVINGAVTAILPTHIWHARLTGEDESAVMLQRVFEEVGVTIRRTPIATDKMKPGETNSIEALEKAFRQYGKGILSLALRTVTATGGGNPGYIRAQLINATCYVLGSHPEWYAEPENVLRAIKSVGIKYLWAKAENRRAMPGKDRVSLFKAYVEELTKLLDSHFREKRIA